MILLVHDYVPYLTKTFADFDYKEIGATLKKGVELISDMSNWWIATGVALCLYRDGDFCKDDGDIDVHFRTNRHDVESLYVEIKRRFSGWGVVREMFYNQIPIQVCFSDENGVYFDVCFLFDDIYSGSSVFLNEHGEMITKNMEIKMMDTKYGQLPFLSPIEDYLSLHYGDWKTPSRKKGQFTHEY